jgi:hypothetical protein
VQDRIRRLRTDAQTWRSDTSGPLFGSHVATFTANERANWRDQGGALVGSDYLEPVKHGRSANLRIGGAMHFLEFVKNKPLNPRRRRFGLGFEYLTCNRCSETTLHQWRREGITERRLLYCSRCAPPREVKRNLPSVPPLPVTDDRDALLRVAIRGDALLAALGYTSRHLMRAPYVAALQLERSRRESDELRNLASPDANLQPALQSWWPEHIHPDMRRPQSRPRDSSVTANPFTPELRKLGYANHLSAGEEWLEEHGKEAMPATLQTGKRVPDAANLITKPPWLDPNGNVLDQLLARLRRSAGGKSR